MKMKFYQIIFCCIALHAQKLNAQTPVAANTTDTIVTANKDYNNAGALKRLFLGDHYRKEWATPVAVKILNIDSAAGGLTPVKLGGGQQTKSLRLKGANGKEYVLRSVNKDPSKVMPPEFVGTFAADIVQDQISSSNPYASLVVAALSEAAGILHSTPEIVYVPASPRLGDFANEFGNTLCLFEERPSGDNIVNTQKLFEKVFSNNDYRVDEKAFLKARLFDIWIGDWDRHEDQWLWAVYKEGGKTFYRPIPRDRDQAFPSLDGIIPQMASKPWLVRRTKNFDYKIHDINGLNMAAASLDRNFTTTLTLQNWVDIAKELQQSLTDEKIEAAVKQFPKDIYAISGTSIIAKLKSRRIELVEYATDYYHFVNKEVNITGTNENELFKVKRLSHDSTVVAVYKLTKEPKAEDLIYERAFSLSETKEVRLYGMGGNDKFYLTGEAGKGTLIRIIGGEGVDSTVDKSSVRGGVHKTKLYDDADHSLNENGELKKYISNDSLKNSYSRTFKYNWFAPKLSPGYNPDDGIFFGGGVVFKKQKFGKAPYGYMQSFSGNYAFATGAYNFWYEGIFKEAVGKWDLQINAKLNAPNYVLNYYGLGNETVKEESKPNDYYRVRANQLIVAPSVFKQLNKKQAIAAGLYFESTKVEESENRFITNQDSKLDSTSFERKYYGGATVNYQFNTTDNPLYPRKGIKINSGVAFIQNFDESKTRFGRLSSNISYYTSYHSFTAAIRVGTATNIGDGYQFYQANTLGGTTNLRGYSRSRYAGKTSMYQNAELRYKFNTINGYILRGNWGLLAFFDNGKVWMPEETSNTWHYGYGGGIWFLPYNKIAFTATYGISKEDKLLSIKAGFLF